MSKQWWLLGWVLAMAAPAASADTVASLLADYTAAGAESFSAERGAEMWRRETVTDGQTRSCVTCHGDDLGRPGKHARTGKAIDPMAPSANAARLTERGKIEKWFLRNCKWTLGRECTAREKGDFLAFLKGQ